MRPKSRVLFIAIRADVNEEVHSGSTGNILHRAEIEHAPGSAPKHALHHVRFAGFRAPSGVGRRGHGIRGEAADRDVVRVQIHAVRIECDRDLRALPPQRGNHGAPNLVGRRRCEHLILIREDFEVPNAEDLRCFPDLSFADTRQVVARTNVAGFAAFAARRGDDADLHARNRVLGDSCRQR